MSAWAEVLDGKTFSVWGTVCLRVHLVAEPGWHVSPRPSYVARWLQSVSRILMPAGLLAHHCCVSGTLKSPLYHGPEFCFYTSHEGTSPASFHHPCQCLMSPLRAMSSFSQTCRGFRVPTPDHGEQLSTVLHREFDGC